MPKNRKKTVIKKAAKTDGIAFSLITIGLILIVISNLYSVHHRGSLWFGRVPTKSAVLLTENQVNQPIRINIPSLSLSLPVTEAGITNHQWEVSEHGVSHLNISAFPRTSGNIVLYGHNKATVLGTLPNIKKGAIIKVKTRDNNVYMYRVEKTLVVSPNNIDVLESHGKEMITLYTCIGFADLKRFVVVAYPI